MKKILIAIITYFFIAGYSYAAERIISVNSTAKIKVQSTLANVSLQMIGDGPNADISYQDYARKSLNIMTYLKKTEGIGKLKSSSFSLVPIYDNQAPQRVILGYQTKSNISFQTDVNLLAKIIGYVTQKGITRVNKISYTIDDKQLVAKRNEAQKAAIKDAVQKADSILSDLGYARKDIVKINVTNSEIRKMPFKYDNMLMSNSKNLQEVFVPSEQEISASVSLEISY